MSSVKSAPVGRAEPRLWTRPRRRLTPRTSKGFEVITFAKDVLGVILLPWQRWLLIHALELNEDGTYRYRYVFVFVSRQNGKTTVLAVLALWRLLVDEARLVLGTSTNLDYAREAWEQAVELAKENEYAAPEFVWPERRTNGEQTLTTKTEYPDPSGSGVMLKRKAARYKIAAATRRGGRSLSVDLAIADELREHQTFQAWGALDGTTTARKRAQLWALSNMGDDTSVVLNHYRGKLVELDDRTGAETVVDVHQHAIFEWSAPLGCELDDWQAIAQANPALGHTIDAATILGKMEGDVAVYRTEHLCQHVRVMDSPLDMAAWGDAVDELATMDASKRRACLVLETTPKRDHATLAAAVPAAGGRVQLEIVAAWPSLDLALDELPELLAAIRPRAFGWLPGGPLAAAAPDLRKLKRPVPKEIKGEVPAVCQSFAQLVNGRRLIHNGDPLLTTQLAAVTKKTVGDGWRFDRSDGNADAVYAAAGAAWLARTLPVIKSRRVIRARDRQTERGENGPGKGLLSA